MALTVSPFALRAKQLEIEALQHLAGRIELVGAIGALVHALQRERGLSSVFLASSGQQFAQERQGAQAEALAAERRVRTLFDDQREPARGTTARLMALMAWVLLDLEALETLRQQIAARQPSANEAVASFSRVIAALVELVFHLADATGHPDVTRLLVAIVHLVQGKEAAGQERAVGGQLYAGGQCEEGAQQRILHLIEAQERSFAVFDEFADPAVRERWQQAQLTPEVAQLERMRRTLCSARPGAALPREHSSTWFDVCSHRITEMWRLEGELVAAVSAGCARQIGACHDELRSAEGLVAQLRQQTPAHADAVARFFQAEGSPLSVPLLRREHASAPADPSLLDMLAQQSARLASMEVELESARRALHERKVIERAKGALMSRLGLTEEAAFRTLQKTAMDHNRRLVDVAQAALALPDIAFTKKD